MLAQQTIDIIKSTAPVLEIKGTEITSHFYKKLFKNHPELLNIFNHVNQKKGRQQTALANTVYAAAQNIDRLEQLLPAVKQIAHKHRSLGIKPEQYPIVGEHLLLAIEEVLGDAATDEILEAWGEAYGVIAQVFIDVEEEMYQEAEAKEAGWRGFKDFTMIKKKTESSLITSFYLKPNDGQKVPSYLPGQYITVRLGMPGEEYLFNRQYSLSSAPNGEYFRISVKREAEYSPEGKVSNYLHDKVSAGDVIEVSAPAGDFYLEPSGHSPVTLISGGVGITPMFSMLEDISRLNPSRQTVFVHASRNEEVQAFKEEVIEIIDKMDNGKAFFAYESHINSEAGCDHLGYINRNVLESLVDRDSTCYVCGPAPFMKAVISSLMSIGISLDRIRYEFFGPALKFELQEAISSERYPGNK
ncbi:NO-inducible flavohemoprotein [Rossellomorea vietnamensis]|uniref:Flavohemoprotein n=1 Tax=Rossellomorea vietnamensis TaxID=218284 RepID=A0A5D4NNK0_9BACI|nr:NO-inducible flavohemoprotein [Rossellomorea vietnamensis]TYS14956.1 NO-inducible flavohemoprotein [Rossellomorea vietnamensis]